jgi:hypothetical protein
MRIVGLGGSTINQFEIRVTMDCLVTNAILPNDFGKPLSGFVMLLFAADH